MAVLEGTMPAAESHWGECGLVGALLEVVAQIFRGL